MPIQAIIFDFNGVIVDDESFHLRGFQESLRPAGFDLTLTTYRRDYQPYEDGEFFRRFFRDQGARLDPQQLAELVRKKRESYFRQLGTSVPAIFPTVQFIRELPDYIPIAIASAATREEITVILDRLDILKRFLAIVAAGEVPHSKPDPAAFDEARARLNDKAAPIAAESVLVVEDSAPGVDAALSAGMMTLALTTAHPASQFPHAHLVLSTLQGESLASLEAKIAQKRIQ